MAQPKKVAKKASKKRASKKKRPSSLTVAPEPKSSKWGIAALVLILGVAVVLANTELMQDDPSRKNCPRAVEGASEPELTIKLFDSPFCFYCHMQEPSIKRVIEEHGDVVQVQRYDVRYCKEEAYAGRVTGTPGFVFSGTTPDGTDYQKPVIGFLEDHILEAIVCDVTSSCA